MVKMRNGKKKSFIESREITFVQISRYLYETPLNRSLGVILVNSDTVQGRQRLAFDKSFSVDVNSEHQTDLDVGEFSQKKKTHASVFIAILAQGVLTGLTQTCHVRSLQIINMKTSMIIAVQMYDLSFIHLQIINILSNILLYITTVHL